MMGYTVSFLRNEEYITLLDYFAGKALNGMLAFSESTSMGNWNTNSNPEGVATHAYKYADAMLKERAKYQNNNN